MKKYVHLSIDDVIDCFAWVQNKKAKSIFDEPMLAELLFWHQKYNLTVDLYVFECKGQFNICNLDDCYWEELRDNSDWLKLCWHRRTQGEPKDSTKTEIESLNKVYSAVCEKGAENCWSSIVRVHYWNAPELVYSELKATGVKYLLTEAPDVNIQNSEKEISDVNCACEMACGVLPVQTDLKLDYLDNEITLPQMVGRCTYLIQKRPDRRVEIFFHEWKYKSISRKLEIFFDGLADMISYLDSNPDIDNEKPFSEIWQDFLCAKIDKAYTNFPEPKENDNFVKFISFHVPYRCCNLRCTYCYVMDNAEFTNEQIEIIKPELVRRLFSKKRLGGMGMFNFCAAGETCLHPTVIPTILELLKEGHCVQLVTNGTITNAFKHLVQAKVDLSGLFVKFSYHYLMLKERNLLDTFFENVALIKQSGASLSVEMVAADDYIDYIDEIKEVSLKNMGALPHLSIPRKDTATDKHLDSKFCEAEYIEKWECFDSGLFDYKMKLLHSDTSKFCMTGQWSLVINLKDGDIAKCLFPSQIGNVLENVTENIVSSRVGKTCTLPYCFNCHIYHAFGLMPLLDAPYYDGMRNRICNDGTQWLNERFRKVYRSKFIERHSEKKHIYLIGVPEHGNLGDHRITDAEKEFIGYFCQNQEIVEISVNEYWDMKPILRQMIQKNELIILTGGGNLGNLWPRNEMIRQDAIKTWPLNHKIVMPQSVYFTDDDEGKAALEKAKGVYSNPYLTVVCRDRSSYEFVQREFACNSILTPDIVLSLKCRNQKKEKKYILVCLRSDIESVTSEEERKLIIQAAKETGYPVRLYDTVRPFSVHPGDSAIEIEKSDAIFSEAALVITDRLHGMIFAALNGCKCIVIPNSYHKVREQADWLSACSNIKMSNSTEEVLKLLKNSQDDWEIIEPDLGSEFDILRQQLVDMTEPENYQTPFSMAVKQFDRLIKDYHSDPNNKYVISNIISTIASGLDILPDRASMCNFLKYVKEKGISSSSIDSDTEEGKLVRCILSDFSLTRVEKTERNFHQLKAAEIDFVPKVSVILPVYNVKPWLEESLRSLTEQTLKEIEIICIDDGSDDGSLELLLYLADKDNRLSVYTQKNSGLSAVRNQGISIAKGEYIHFMDSDDYLDTEAYEVLYNKATNDKLDVLQFAGEPFIDESEGEIGNIPIVSYHISQNYEVQKGIDLLYHMRSANDYYTVSQTRFIRREYLINNCIDYVDGILHEDNIFGLRILLNTERAAAITNAFFHRRYRYGSIMTRDKGFDHLWGYFVCYKEMTRHMLEFSEFGAVSSDVETEIYRYAYFFLNSARRYFFGFNPRLREWAERLIPDYFKEEFIDSIRKRCDEKDEIKHLKSQVKGLSEIRTIQSDVKFFQNQVRNASPGRIDILCENEDNDKLNDFEIISKSGKGIRVVEAAWFKNRGKGYMIETLSGEIDVELLCSEKSKLTIWVRGVDSKGDDGKRKPVWVDCTKIEIDGDILLSDRKTISHDDYIQYKKEVKESRRIQLVALYDSAKEIVESQRDSISCLQTRIKELEDEKLILIRNIEEARNQNDNINQLLNNTFTSKSYRIGRMITAIPRYIKAKILKLKCEILE